MLKIYLVPFSRSVRLIRLCEALDLSCKKITIDFSSKYRRSPELRAESSRQSSCFGGRRDNNFRPLGEISNHLRVFSEPQRNRKILQEIEKRIMPCNLALENEFVTKILSAAKISPQLTLWSAIPYS